MEDSNMRDLRNVRNATIALGVLFVIVIVAISIIRPMLSEVAIEKTDAVTTNYLNNDDLSNIEKKIKTELGATYDLSENELSNLKMVIREDTFARELDETSGSESIKFLIDLNRPKITYQIKYFPSSGTISLDCSSVELAQDQDVFCIGSYDRNTIDVELGKYLPYRGTAGNGVEFSVWHQTGDSYSKPQLEVQAFTCDESDMPEVESAVKEWVKSKGIPNPDIIPLNLNNYCFHGE